MGSAKAVLTAELAAAFEGRPDMPLMAVLDGVTDAEARWCPSPDAPSIDQIVRHIAWSKSRFCQQAFGVDMVLNDPRVSPEGDTEGVPRDFPCGCAYGVMLRPGIAGAVGLLREAHRVMTRCLDELPEQALAHPLPVHHGSSALNFFWTMVMHDVFHAGQIRTRRTCAAAGTPRV